MTGHLNSSLSSGCRTTCSTRISFALVIFVHVVNFYGKIKRWILITVNSLLVISSTCIRHPFISIILGMTCGWIRLVGVWKQQESGGSYNYVKSHCGDKKILWPSDLRNWISFTGKITYSYWMRALVYHTSYISIQPACEKIRGSLCTDTVLNWYICKRFKAATETTGNGLNKYTTWW